jgi:hypothetical protein
MKNCFARRVTIPVSMTGRRDRIVPLPHELLREVVSGRRRIDTDGFLASNRNFVLSNLIQPLFSTTFNFSQVRQ